MNILKVHGSSLGQLEEWFEIARVMLNQPEILPYNVYNMDETGVRIGALNSAKRLITTVVLTLLQKVLKLKNLLQF